MTGRGGISMKNSHTRPTLPHLKLFKKVFYIIRVL